MANVLEGIGYLVAAVAVLAVLASGGFLIIALGILIGVIVSVGYSVIMTASALKAFFESDKPKR